MTKNCDIVMKLNEMSKEAIFLNDGEKLLVKDAAKRISDLFRENTELRERLARMEQIAMPEIVSRSLPDEEFWAEDSCE